MRSSIKVLEAAALFQQLWNTLYVARYNELVNFDKLLMTVVVQNVSIEHYRINFLYLIAYTQSKPTG